MKKILVIALFGMVVVVGCSRKAAPSTTSQVRDSTIVKEVPRLVEVLVPGETVTVVEYIECDGKGVKPVTRSASSGRAKVDITIAPDGKLTVRGGFDSLMQVVKAMDREIFRLRHENKTTTHVEYVRDPYWFDIAARWIAVIVIVLVAVRIYFKLR